MIDFYEPDGPNGPTICRYVHEHMGLELTDADHAQIIAMTDDPSVEWRGGPYICTYIEKWCNPRGEAPELTDQNRCVIWTLADGPRGAPGDPDPQRRVRAEAAAIERGDPVRVPKWYFSPRDYPRDMLETMPYRDDPECVGYEVRSDDTATPIFV